MHKSIKTWIAIKNISNGVIERDDGKIIKIVEAQPVNFSLKSKAEQENILYNYRNFFNTCNFDIQILVQSKKGNLDNHILRVKENMKNEKDDKLINLMKEYIDIVKRETLKTAITKRFFIVFASDGNKNSVSMEQILIELQEKTLKLKNTLSKCGNMLKEIDNNELINLVYTYMNPITSEIQELKEFNYEYKD